MPEIKVTQRKDHGDYHACLVSDESTWGCGKTINEAIGDCIISHSKDFNVQFSAEWKLVGYDTFDSSWYPLPGEFMTEDIAEAAAIARLKELDKTQSTETSGGQRGIQDQVFIVRPDGSKYRFERMRYK